MMTKLTAVLVGTLAVACNAAGDATSAPVFPEGVAIAADDGLLRLVGMEAAGRLDAASGVTVYDSGAEWQPEGGFVRTVPIVWGELGNVKNGEALGYWNGETVTVDPAVKADPRLGSIVLHEIMHALGCNHVGEGEGVMAPHIAAPESLTEQDLTELCGIQTCSRFAPEQ